MAEESDEEVDVLGDEENEKETPGSVGSDAVEEVGEVEAVKVEEDLQMLNQPVQPQVEQEQQTTKPAKIEKEKKVETKLEDTPFVSGEGGGRACNKESTGHLPEEEIKVPKIPLHWLKINKISF